MNRKAGIWICIAAAAAVVVIIATGYIRRENNRTAAGGSKISQSEGNAVALLDESLQKYENAGAGGTEDTDAEADTV